jgi:hypothetical protein
VRSQSMLRLSRPHQLRLTGSGLDQFEEFRRPSLNKADRLACCRWRQRPRYRPHGRQRAT